MYMIKVALVVLVAPLCRGSSDSALQAAAAMEIVEVGSHGHSKHKYSSSKQSHLVRSETDALNAQGSLQRAEARPHVPSQDQPAALAESEDAHFYADTASQEARAKVTSLAKTAVAAQKERSGIAKMNASIGDSPKVDLGWAPCDWQRPTTDQTMHCVDGSYCNPKTDQWTCCATHGGRLQCPKDFPKMCNQMDCGGNDYCCATWCEYYDGDKPCSIKHQIYGMDFGWLTMLTRDDQGDVLQEWTDLTAGPMTWELWYARRPQAEANTNDGNAIMATYADNHNSDAYTTHNRRRNIGVYIQPDTGKLSLSAFVGDSVQADPADDDPLGGAHVMLGPAISDNNWHHIAVVWNRTEGKGWLSLDGVRHHEGVKYEPGDENPGLDGKLVIGGGHLGKTTTCQVSQFRLWKVGLHENQLQRIMQCGEPDLPISDLKGFYRLSGNFDNSQTSGFLPLQWEATQGVFADGEPCAIGPPGLKGEDAFGGPKGLQGAPGKQGDKGPASSEWGPPGPQGPNGTKGPPGKAPPPLPNDMFGAASWTDFYIVLGISVVVTLLAGIAIYVSFIKGGGDDGKAAGGGGENWGAENWEGY